MRSVPATVDIQLYRRVSIARGDRVHLAFWLASSALLFALGMHLPLDSSAATQIATAVFIMGGLPHGAYDIAMLSRTASLGWLGLSLAVCMYVAVAGAMTILWMTIPVAALVMFIVVACVHFGQDWTMLDEPLLKVAAGAAIISAPAFSHPAEVTRLFVVMSDGVSGTLVARIMQAVAPVSLLITAVGILIAWRNGAYEWAAATTICIALLMLAPPVAGFALFFVFLHSPRHLYSTRAILSEMPRSQWLATGAAMSCAAIGGWMLLTTVTSFGVTDDLTGQSFQLLAAVALPHLLLSGWIEHRPA
jgi:beta-carotene 15,15'-dioxygenase